MSKRLLSVVLLLLLCTGPVPAATVDDGIQAFTQNDFATARDIWMPLAEAGDAKATFYMSLLYAQGKGVDENRPLAMEFLAAAARQGLPVAQFNLGNHYNQGKWVAEDPGLAAYWYRQAGNRGMARAQHNLAGLYLIGRGVDKDLELARHWYERAASNGSKPSAEMLANLPQPGEAQPPQQAFAALDHAWVKRQPGDKFTLQLLASGSREAVDRLLGQHKFKRQVAVYQYASKGKQLYAIGYGRFDSAELARRAIAELPAALRRSSPWPRRFADIQALIE